jgi:hypothetical protein
MFIILMFALYFLAGLLIALITARKYPSTETENAYLILLLWPVSLIQLSMSSLAWLIGKNNEL